jgi:lipopolysaccharide heptosyltransferase I
MNALIVRLGALGDIVHAIPAVAALRRAHPEARIDWLVGTRNRSIVDLVTAIDRVVAVDTALHGWTRAVQELRAARYDVALDFQGLLKSAVLARASGAAKVVGFSVWHLREKTARPFYSAVAPADGVHVIVKNLRLLEAVGIHDAAIEFPLAPVASAALDAIRAQHDSAPFALINPGAAWPNKRWPAARFGEIASFVRDVCKLVPIVLWGPGEEALADEVRTASGEAAVLAPPTGVADVVAIARAATLMISGDTGPLHLAAAVGTPTVSVFGPTDPARKGPYAEDDVAVSRYEACGCQYDRSCHQREWCLAGLPAAEVCAAVQRCLGARSRRG